MRLLTVSGLQNLKIAGWLAAVLAAMLLMMTSPVLADEVSRESLEKRISDQAVSLLEAAVTAPHDSVFVDLDLPMVLAVAGQVTDFKLDIVSSKAAIGTVPLKITLFLRDGTTLPLLANARIRLFDRVSVVARRLGRHQTVSGDDLRLERREVTSLTDGYYPDSRQVIGKRTKRMISAGGVLQASDIENVPLVTQGSGVIVSVVIGAVTVTSKGKALEDGELGDVINVQHLVTGRRLAGTIAGKGLVMLEGSDL